MITKNNSFLVTATIYNSTAIQEGHPVKYSDCFFQAGFNVWSLEYRRTGETGGGWPTTYEDIKT